MPNINPELILSTLKWAKFDPEYAGKALQMAAELSQAELKKYHESSGAQKVPGHYPSSRLLEASALVNMKRYDEAQRIVEEEIPRYSAGFNSGTYFFLECHIGLAVVIAGQTPPVASKTEWLETLVGKMNPKSTVPRKNSNELAKLDDLTNDDVINSALKPGLAHKDANGLFDYLLQRLTDNSYHFVTPFSPGEYEMPRP